MSTETTPQPQWVDLLIEPNPHQITTEPHRDLVLDQGGMPAYIDGLACIAQDIQHMLMDTGLLLHLVGERSSLRWSVALQQIENEIEEDQRIIPGSVMIERVDEEQVRIEADTLLGSLNWTLSPTALQTQLPA